MPRPCKWNAVSFLSTYVVRSSWQTTPSGLTPLKMNPLKLNISFQMAGSPSQARKTSFKMTKRGETTPHKKVESLLLADLLGGIEEETPTILPWRLRKPVIDNSNLSFAADNPLRMLVAREMIEDLQESLVCYTDASRTTYNKAGIGIYIPKKNVNISLRTSSHSCISSIELAAIEDCLVHVKDSYQGETFDIVISNDFLSALEALKDCNHLDRNINKTVTIISEIQESGKKVTLVWVPAHVGIPGNEKADALAKAATTREQIDRWIPASIKDVKRAVDRNIIQQWQTRWVSDPRSQHHKTIEKLVSTRSKFQCASRRKEIISKLRIEKCALNQHLFLLKRHPDGKCQVCPQEDENVRHFLMECPDQSVLREEIKTRTNLR